MGEPSQPGACTGENGRYGRIRVVIADDMAIIRAGLAELIRAEPDMEVIGEAADGEQALEMAGRLRPSVVLMDLSMPRMSGLDAIRAVCSACPEVRVIGLSMHEREEYEALVRGSGAAAYVMKDAPTRELIAAIRTVCGPRGAADL